MPETDIKKGDLLLSQPFMLDGNFSRTVVYLAEFNEEGAVGFIINRPMDIKMDELIPDFPEIDLPAYFGGPVSTDTIHYVHRVGELLEESIQISENLYWGGSFEQLKVLIDKKLVTENDIRFFVGYSGWTSGQLEGELQMGSWLKGEMDPNYLFNHRSGDLWKKVVRNKGEIYKVIADIPGSELLN